MKTLLVKQCFLETAPFGTTKLKVIFQRWSMLAIARAISDGLVYLYDEPSQMQALVVKPFIYSNGKVIRANVSATEKCFIKALENYLSSSLFKLARLVNFSEDKLNYNLRY